jgi:hypothetical protein
MTAPIKVPEMWERHAGLSKMVLLFAAACTLPQLALAFDCSRPTIADSRVLTALARATSITNDTSGNRYTYTYFANSVSPNKTIFTDVNNKGAIAGYYETPILPPDEWQYPITGFVFSPPYAQADLVPIKVARASQTEPSVINNDGVLGGYWADSRSFDFGFVLRNNSITTYKHPSSIGKIYNKITGLNDHGMAVGYYTEIVDDQPMNRPFKLNYETGEFGSIFPPKMAVYGSATANSINNKGHIVGCYTGTFSKSCFLIKDNAVTNFSCPGGAYIESNSINNADEIVGRCDAKLPYVGFLVSDVDKAPDFRFFVPPDNDKDVGLHLTGINDGGEMVGYLQESKEKVISPRSYYFLAKPLPQR